MNHTSILNFSISPVFRAAGLRYRARAHILAVLCFLLLTSADDAYGAEPSMGLNADGTMYVHPRTAPPTKEQIQQVQSDFLQLTLPIQFRLHTTRRFVGEGLILDAEPHYRRELLGEAKVLQDTYHPALIAWSLTQFLDDPSHDAEAFLILSTISAKFEGMEWSRGTPCTFKSRAEPGDWPQRQSDLIDIYKSEGHRIGSQGIDHTLVSDWRAMDKLQRYRVAPSDLLPSAIKKSPSGAVGSAVCSATATSSRSGSFFASIREGSPSVSTIYTKRGARFTNAVEHHRCLDRGDAGPSLVAAQAAFVSVGHVQRCCGLRSIFPPRFGSSKSGLLAGGSRSPQNLYHLVVKVGINQGSPHLLP